MLVLPCSDAYSLGRPCRAHVQVPDDTRTIALALSLAARVPVYRFQLSFPPFVFFHDNC